MRSVFVLLWLLPLISYSQPRPKEAGIILENDLFTSSKNDRYYTNGIEIFYRYLNKDTSVTLQKSVSEFRIGQYIYNPQSVKAANFYVNDRPFAGYLFGQYGVTRFYRNESLLKLQVQGGVIGPSSYARQVQEAIHNTFGYKSVEGWQYQVTDAMALQLGVFYSKKIAAFKSNVVDFHGRADGNLGTIFTGASIGITSRIRLDKMLPLFDSNLYGGAMNSANDRELYFYVSPMLNYQLYDATIQGSLFNDTSPVTFDLVPYRFNGEAGFKFRRKNFNASYVFVYRGKELYNRVITGYYYGSISLSLLFK